MQKTTLNAPVQGQVRMLAVQPGDTVAAGQVLVVLESMKMEVPVEAPVAGQVQAVWVQLGDVVAEGEAMLSCVAVAAGQSAWPPAAPAPAPAAALAEHPQAEELRRRRHALTDAARPEAAARRHAAGGRTVRENLAALLDPGSFTEYGGLAVAAQRSRRPLDELIAQTPADGLVTGVGTVGAPVLGTERARCAVLAYDYSVLAGTQGVFNHRKADRLLEVAERLQLPVVLFAEGGGGRPGDVDWPIVAGLDCPTFARWAGLAGRVPRVAVVAGRCFAGNAALAGSADVLIATESASLGMGGPAMIEGGGLGRVAAEDVGPVHVLAPAGVVDVRVPDEAAAVEAARRYLGYFQGPLPAGPAADQRPLRQAVPAHRQAIYDPRPILATLADAGSVMELRADFGPGVVTALARIDGLAVAVAASHPRHLGGALDAAACDKLARFMQLADAFGLPLVTLVDTPGFMVGPAAEATGLVRHAGRLFVQAAALRVPVFSVVLRRGYGLGAMALTAGHFHAPVATVAWPGAEFGAMGIEGAVRLGFRKELEAAGAGREALFERLVAEHVARGRAINLASHLEIDDVIDPAETRDWLLRGLRTAAATPLPPRRATLDTW
ncbi:carboxyl transferase domain-containing protein [Ideonella sp.]|uniref:carboxyl transferase domain-containing protein n=1 Tax=Ideonella sp. TaxID=1929293 RepID=UPI0035B3A2C3